MGIRGELYSTRVGCEGRTYFFNVKENRMGDMFLTVVESKPNESEGFERRSVVVFREDLPNFLKAFQGALDFMSGGEGAAGTAKYEPSAGAAAARKSRSPSGFAGSGDPSAGSGDQAAGSGDPEVPGGGKKPAEGARRKKIVVKRKSSAPKPDAEG